MEKLTELRRRLDAAVTELNTEAIVSDAEAYSTKEAEITEIEGMIERAVKANERAALLSKPVEPKIEAREPDASASWTPSARSFGLRGAENLSPGHLTTGIQRQFDHYLRAARANIGFKPTERSFQTFGEQLQAVFSAAMSTRSGNPIDNRLQRAPTGSSEVDPTGGGFLVQTDFMEAIFMLAHDMGEILGRVNKVPISDRSNGIKINAVDESSRSTGSRWGGVQSYWVGEGTTVTPSKPKFRRVEFDLKKLFSLAYMTDELLQDSTAMTAILGQAFAEEIMFMTEDAIFEGTGAGQPLGIINSSALVSVPKQTGQASGTILKENIDAMWSRLWSRSRKDAVWLVNQDILPSLYSLVQVVGTAGAPVYLPPGGYSTSPYATLLGRPVIETEYSSALGSPGDILLADLSQYTIIDKGGVNAATSMHIAFLTDEMVFRVTYRVDGKPMWKDPITPFKGSNTRSPFVAIAQR